MKYIANLLADKQNMFSFDKTIKMCLLKEDIIPTIPTIIIGYNLAKTMIQNFSILEKCYPEQNLYWTFSKYEKKGDYNLDIENFYNIATHKLIDGIKYQYVNIYQIKYNKIKNIINFINNEQHKLILYDGKKENFFIYNKKQKIIYGISLNTCEYVGIPKDKIIKKINENKKNIIISTISCQSDRIRRIIYNKIYYFLPIYEYLNN